MCPTTQFYDTDLTGINCVHFIQNLNEIYPSNLFVFRQISAESLRQTDFWKFQSTNWKQFSHGMEFLGRMKRQFSMPAFVGFKGTSESADNLQKGFKRMNNDENRIK